MKRILLTTLTILSLTTSCKSADTFNLYKDEMSDLLRDPKTRTFKGGENDVNDLRGCNFLIELSVWYERESKWGKSWWRENVWKYGHINNYKQFLLHEDADDLSNQIIQNKLIYPVYIGPWKTITLTRTEEEGFFRKKEITEQKQIRFFAYTGIGGGEIEYQYESKTEENKNIPEKKFSLSPNAKIAPDKFGLCVTKWTAKYGYNAIAEVKSKNPFSKNYLVPTGRVIDSETKEVIADEKDNLVKSVKL